MPQCSITHRDADSSSWKPEEHADESRGLGEPCWHPLLGSIYWPTNHHRVSLAAAFATVPNIPGACIWPDRALLQGALWEATKEIKGLKERVNGEARTAVANIRSRCCHPTHSGHFWSVRSLSCLTWPGWESSSTSHGRQPLSGYQNRLLNFQLQT